MDHKSRLYGKMLGVFIWQCMLCEVKFDLVGNQKAKKCCELMPSRVAMVKIRISEFSGTQKIKVQDGGWRVCFQIGLDLMLANTEIR